MNDLSKKDLKDILRKQSSSSPSFGREERKEIERDILSGSRIRKEKVNSAIRTLSRELHKTKDSKEKQAIRAKIKALRKLF